MCPTAQTETKMISLTANGRTISAPAGTTLLQALLQAKVHVPHLCYDLRLVKSNGNCGLCMVELGDGRHVKACRTPAQPGMQVITSNPKIEAYRKLRLEQLLSDHNADCLAPCVQTCPAGIDIQSYLRQTMNGNYEAALRVIKDRNPFPSACGRVCPHPCEAQCRRSLVDEPVGINFVKRFLSDWDMGREKPWAPACAPATGKRLAIVGAGPSGLSAAYYSAIQGHEVTVFERMPLPGGMLRYGIPEYRLPKATLDQEIGIIQSLGVRILTEKTLGTHIRLEDLQKSYDAVYLAIGSWRATPMQIDGDTLEGVWLGIQYLAAITKGVDVISGPDAIVVGGGNTAIDCARTALRKGAKSVKLVYRRTRDEMPAAPLEIEEALHEGVEMLFLAAPQRITAVNGKKQLHCMRMELGEPDRSGRRRPVPVEGSDFALEADVIIGAIGQSTNTQFLYNDLPVQLNKWGDIQIDGKTLQTSAEKVFAGGDCVTGPATVIEAVGVGRRAATSIHQFLTQGYVSESPHSYSCSRGSLEDLPRHEFDDEPRVPRKTMPALPVDSRKSFAEVELGLSESDAREEAMRCLRCGCSERYQCELRGEASAHGIEHRTSIEKLNFLPKKEDHLFIVRDHNKCISCGRCVAACSEIAGPDVLALYVKSGKMLVGTKSGQPLKDTDCVSCGQCVTVCPCGALTYQRDRGKVFRALNDESKFVVGFVAPAVRSVIASHFNLPFDQLGPFIAGLLKRVGFDRVFDFTFAADLTIMEETTEFLTRFTGKREEVVLPQFTSCCPGWVNFVERRYPELIPHLSSCKSPQQMMAATVKNHFSQWAHLTPEQRENLFVVSIVPCLAKKFEANRPEFAPDGIPDVDAVLTTTELIEMIELARIDVSEIQPTEFDEPYRQVSGAGMLFGVSGGVAEAALRMAMEKVTGEFIDNRLDFVAVRGLNAFKEAEVTIGDRKVRLAVISGLKNAIPVMEKIAAGVDVGYDLIEVMSCPTGCVGGAGHPVPEGVTEMRDRARVLFDIDRNSKLRKSHTNPDILRLYEEFYKEPNSEIAHKLLHTHYHGRGGDSHASQIRNKADSALATRTIEICLCDECQSNHAGALFDSVESKVQDLGLDSFVDVNAIRITNHNGSGIYVTIDGQRVAQDKVEGLVPTLRR